VDDILRRKLINALKNRRWTLLDAERAAAFVAGLDQAGEGEWKVWPSETKGLSHYRVARRASALSVYDSPQEGRARDVSNALNEIERDDSDATGTP
jgi:hypothetical protein